MVSYHAVPRLGILGGVLASVMFLIAYLAAGLGLAVSGVDGFLALVGWHVLVGVDLIEDEAYADVHGLSTPAAAAIVNGAVDTIKRIRQTADSLRDTNMKAKLKEIAYYGDTILNQIMASPAKIPSASRFFQVYLGGVATVGEKFVALQKYQPDKATEFVDFLAQAKTTCEAQQKALTADDVFDLDVDITVLKRRMLAQS